MRISRLRVDNFRSIETLDTEVPRVWALIGPNNAGKSNILGALYKVLGRQWLQARDFSEDDVYAHDATRDINIEIELDPPLSYSKQKLGQPTSIAGIGFQFTRYKVGPFKGQRRLEKACFDAKGATPMVLARAPKKGEPHKYEPIVGLPDEIREQIPLIYLGSPRQLSDQLPGARYSLLRQLFEDIDRDFNDPQQTVVVDGPAGLQAVPRRERFGKLMAEVLDVLRTTKFKELETSLTQHALRQLGLDPVKDADRLSLFFSPFDSATFYHTLEMRVNEGAFSVNATDLGHGVQNAIVVAILQAFEERRKQGAVLLIEEPEMFLHPQMQRSLYKTLRRIGETNQVIYTTHSPHFVSVPDYSEIGLVRRRVTSTDVTMSALPLDRKQRERLIKELDPERSEMFFASKVVLVEGDTEKLAFPEYAKALGLDLDRAGVTIVEVGGKRNLMELAKIAASFKIPVCVVYDEDSSDFKDKRTEEQAYNASLDGFAKQDGSIVVRKFSKRYEDHLRGTLGEAPYQALCQKYAAEAGRSKAVQARLIAAEPQSPVPPIVKEVLEWAVAI